MSKSAEREEQAQTLQYQTKHYKDQQTVDFSLDQKMEQEVTTFQSSTDRLSDLLKQRTKRFTTSLGKAKAKQKTIISKYKGKYQQRKRRMRAWYRS